jgi:hypothetical protein
MTLRYKLFGIPGNSEEFLEIVRNWKESGELERVFIIDDWDGLGFRAVAVSKKRVKRYKERVWFWGGEDAFTDYVFISRDDIIKGLKKYGLEPTIVKEEI